MLRIAYDLIEICLDLGIRDQMRLHLTQLCCSLLQSCRDEFVHTLLPIASSDLLAVLLLLSCLSSWIKLSI